MPPHLVHVPRELLGLALERLRLLAVPLLERVVPLLDGVQVDLHLQLRVPATRLAGAGARPQQIVHAALQLLERLLQQTGLAERREGSELSG